MRQQDLENLPKREGLRRAAALARLMYPSVSVNRRTERSHRDKRSARKPRRR